MQTRYFAARILSTLPTSRWAQAIRWFLSLSQSDSPEQIFRMLSHLVKDSTGELSYQALCSEWESIQTSGTRLTFVGEMDYPDALLKVERPPLFLMYRGRLPQTQPLLGIVGSRELRSETRQWLHWNLTPLLREGLLTISGGARGVDQMVHRLALTSGAPTVAILPSGLDCPYPREWSHWQTEVCEKGGAVISELPPGSPMRPHYFHARNRLIAGLSGALVVVQARRSSGSTMSGRLGLSLYRDVGVVPGFPGDRDWLGSCDLLTEGAIVIRDLDDLRTLVDRASSKIF